MRFSDQLPSSRYGYVAANKAATLGVLISGGIKTEQTKTEWADACGALIESMSYMEPPLPAGLREELEKHLGNGVVPTQVEVDSVQPTLEAIAEFGKVVSLAGTTSVMETPYRD